MRNMAQLFFAQYLAQIIKRSHRKEQNWLAIYFHKCLQLASMAPPPGPYSGTSTLALVARVSAFSFGVVYGSIKLKILKVQLHQHRGACVNYVVQGNSLKIFRFIGIVE
ncbi:uncharacterized protein LOC127262252 isoform X1 [Andrographis paniculata]|uniref:uncharacterized protein LOC127262252 isoform X1 n=1 Tax=Andrographis paniculata TaxID=175694 RepID=UPI0021E8FD0A|nr:uncharacterized protein LOC127262252 isoform X1 [Andrographis paniculata]